MNTRFVTHDRIKTLNAIEELMPIALGADELPEETRTHLVLKCEALKDWLNDAMDAGLISMLERDDLKRHIMFAMERGARTLL